jgi:TolA-binding protein
MYSSWNRVVLCLVLAGFCSTALAQEKKKSTRISKASAASEKQGAVATGVVKEKQPTTLRGRLPRYFASLVDDGQRQDIYQIQASYRERIKELQAELAKLELEQMTEIEETLTSTQHKKLGEMRQRSVRGGAKSSSKSAASASEQSSKASESGTSEVAASKSSSSEARKRTSKK